MRLAALRRIQAGWIFSLRDLPDSSWGAVDGFYADIVGRRRESWFRYDSCVRGKFRRAGVRPQAGDGIAFYHARGARFPADDKYQRRPRISLVGKLVGCCWDAGEVKWIAFETSPELSRAIRDKPILRDEQTAAIFERFGLVRSSVATMYYGDAAAWALLWSEIERSLRV